jgi:hypothetical protein
VAHPLARTARRPARAALKASHDLARFAFELLGAIKLAGLTCFGDLAPQLL